MRIPRILHQVWIEGSPVPMPERWMRTWRELHPGWEYRLHTKVTGWQHQKVIDAVPELCGKADVIRYEVLLYSGGVYADADSECVLPLGDSFLEHVAWAAYENETVRPGVIANCTMGAEPGAEVLRDLLERAPYRKLGTEAAWQSVGPTLLTEVARSHSELYVYPARVFAPGHFTGAKAPGFATIHARQHWRSTRRVLEGVETYEP